MAPRASVRGPWPAPGGPAAPHPSSRPSFLARGARGRSARRALGLAGGLLLAAAAPLAWPGVGARGGGVARTVLVLDESESASGTRADYAGWLAEQARARLEQAREDGSEPWVIRFGADVVVRPARGGERDPLAGPAPSGAASELAGALAAAEALLADGRPGRGTLVLFTDGTYTGGDPGPALARLAAQGVALELPALPPADRSDLALAELRLPRAIEAGAPLACELVLSVRGAALAPGSTADVELELLGPAGSERLAAGGLSLGPRGALHRFDLGPALAGRTEVRARVRLRGGDAVPSNDRAAAVVRAGDVRAVAGVAGEGLDPRQRAEWDAWCAGLGALPGLQVVRVEPAGLRALGDTVDAVVSCGVPLVDAERLGLGAFVARGGGWLATGGFELLTGALPALAPLAPAPEEERRVLVLADGSGSMSGRPFAELSEAVLGAMEVAPASERFELWTFTDRVEVRHVLGPGGRDTARAARELLAARPPRGATDVLAALREVAAEVPPPDVVVLVTDGRDPPEPARLAADAAAVRAELAREGAELVVVGAGPERDETALEALAGEAPLRRAEEGLEGVLREELGRGRWTLGARPVAGVRPDTRATDDPAASLARALGALELAPLARAARARLRPGAGTVLELPGGEPVLALARHGRGRVAALASAPVAGFGPAWSAHPEWLAPVVRAVARAPGEDGPRWADPGEGTVLALEGVPADWPPAIESSWEAGGERVRVLLSVPAEVPGADPTAARVQSGPGRAVPEPGAEVLLVAGAGSAGAGRELARLSWTGSNGGKLESSPTPRLLGAVRAAGGGSAGAPGGELREGGAAGRLPERRPHPAGPWLAGVGLFLTGLALALGWDPGRDGRAGSPGMAGGGR